MDELEKIKEDNEFQREIIKAQHQIIEGLSEQIRDNIKQARADQNITILFTVIACILVYVIFF